MCLVLFFSFSPSAYIAPDLYRTGEISWEKLFYDTHYSILDLAEAYPGIEFIIKTHPQQKITDIDFIDRIKQLRNVYFSEGARVSNHLIVNSNVVAGFLTTALIEAMVCGKPIVYSFWGDAKEKWKENIIPFHNSNALFVANNKEDFKKKIIECINLKEIPKSQVKARKIFINEFFNQCDGKSAKRTIDTINRIV